MALHKIHPAPPSWCAPLREALQRPWAVTPEARTGQAHFLLGFCLFPLFPAGNPLPVTALVLERNPQKSRGQIRLSPRCVRNHPGLGS